MGRSKDFVVLMSKLYGRVGPSYDDSEIAKIIWDTATKSCNEYHNNILLALSKEVLM